MHCFAYQYDEESTSSNVNRNSYRLTLKKKIMTIKSERRLRESKISSAARKRMK